MKEVDSKLAELLNDPSFCNWLNGDGSIEEIRNWEMWLAASDERTVIVGKARKIASMPFIEVNLDSQEVLNELEKLKNQSPKLRLKKI